MRDRPPARDCIRPFGALAAVVLVATLSVSTPARAGPDANFSCARDSRVIAAIGEQLRSGSDVFVDAPPSRPQELVNPRGPDMHLAPLTLSSSTWREGWIGEAPPPDLVALWVKQPVLSAARCLPRGQKADKIIAAKDEKRTREALPLIGSSVMFVRIGRPIFSADNRRALILYSSQGRSIGGQETIFYLKLESGGWALSGKKVFSVS